MHTPSRTASSRRSAGSNRSGHRSSGGSRVAYNVERAPTTYRSNAQVRRCDTRLTVYPRPSEQQQQQLLPPPRSVRPRPPLRSVVESTRVLGIGVSPSSNVAATLDSIATKLNYCTNILLSTQTTLQALRHRNDSPSTAVPLSSTHADPSRPSSRDSTEYVASDRIAAEPDSVTRVSCTCSACKRRRREPRTIRSDASGTASEESGATTSDEGGDANRSRQPFAAVDYKLDGASATSPTDVPGREYNSSTCIICLGHIRDTLLMPCRHLYSCDRCYRKQRETRCSICYARVETTTHVFLA